MTMRPIIKALKPSNFIDINKATKEELFNFNKREQNNLIRRRKVLQDRINNNPGMYSPFGLKALQGRIDEAGQQIEGIPSVSKTDGINDLRAKAKKMMELNSMRTTRVQGAKDVQREQTRLAVGLPTKGRLNAADTRLYNEAIEYNKKHPDFMSTFWDGFQEYKRESAARGIDSERLLEEYRPVISKATADGYTAMSDIASIIEEYADEKYKEEQKNMYYAADIRKGSGWEL